PKRVSAGEQLLLNPAGGAISLISTTRVVYEAPASALNRNIFRSLLARVNNNPKKLGEIVRDAKNDVASSDKLKFSLFGDPSIQLAIPYNNVQTNSINGQEVGAGVLDTLEALSKVTIQGQVNDVNDQKITSFSGILNVSVFDKPSERETLNNDGARYNNGQLVHPVP